MTYYVAVVANQNPLNCASKTGSLACFVKETKEEAIALARKAADVWEDEYHTRDHRFADGTTFMADSLKGPYRILVGTLSEEAVFPVKFELVEAK